MEAPAVNPEVFRLFPTFIWKSRLEEEARAPIRRAILDRIDALRSGLGELGVGEVWQSQHGLHTLPELAPFLGHVLRSVEQVFTVLSIGAPAFEVTGCWANVAAPGGAVRMHSHPNNFLSGVYYVQVQPGADTINFHDPRPQTAIVRPPVGELTALNTDQVVLRVEEGALVIFPSWLVHSVDPNRSRALRISVSFNAMFSSYAETMSRPLWGEP
jgi:uncharacterized protein (TIGR02466 family)